MPRIALIHALAHSVDPINQAFVALWPEATRMNLLDDSLSADLAASMDGLNERFDERFIRLADYAVDTGADAILFTCSAFGRCIEGVARRHAGIPVLKPNEAMIDAVTQAAAGQRIGLIATFGPTLQSMPPEFPANAQPDSELAVGALAALNAGDGEGHDRAAVEAALRLAERGAKALALAQFSLARAAPAIQAATGLPVFTTPDSAVLALKARLNA